MPGVAPQRRSKRMDEIATTRTTRPAQRTPANNNVSISRSFVFDEWRTGTPFQLTYDLCCARRKRKKEARKRVT